MSPAVDGVGEDAVAVVLVCILPVCDPNTMLMLTRTGLYHVGCQVL